MTVSCNHVRAMGSRDVLHWDARTTGLAALDASGRSELRCLHKLTGRTELSHRMRDGGWLRY